MKYFYSFLFFLTFVLPLSAQQIEGVKATESSTFTKNPAHKLSDATDGDPDSYAVLYDSTPNGTDETRVPPKGNAPVTGFIWFDLGKVCDVYAVEIVAPRNNFYAPKNLDVLVRGEDGAETAVLKNHTIPYFNNGQTRTVAIPRTRARFIGLNFNSAHDEGRSYWSIIQFAEIRFLGVDAAQADSLDLAKVKINGMNHADALANQNFVSNRLTTPFPMERLIEDWMRQDGIQDFASPADREAYIQKCFARRAERLKNVQNFCRDYIFVKHCQLANQPSFASSAFLSDSVYKDRLGDWRMGSELYHLHVNDDGTVAIRPLLEQKDGIIRDPSVSFDGKTLAFSMRESEADDYHLYTMNLETALGTTHPASPEKGNDAGRVVPAGSVVPVQITQGPGTADMEPCWLPDGDLLFTSTRCDICVPCWSSDVTNIYRCKPDGSLLKRLSFDHAHNVKPAVLNDGRIVYTRWEYNDRNSSPIHKLFMMNADGTTQTEYYGNNSISPWSLIHPAALPGTSKILVIGSGHHTDQSGRLMRIDRTKGTQENEGLEYVSPREDFEPVAVDFFGHDHKQPLFQYPLGINETNWLVSLCPEGNGPREFYPHPFGIYWMNEAGERELLVYDPTISSCQIVPVMKREAPIPRAALVDLSQDCGYFYVQNVYYGPGLQGVEPGTIKKIRVIGLENRAMSAGVSYQQPAAQIHTPVSVGNGSWDVKHVLGTVDVEPDGSAFFKCPPRMGVYFQMLDEKGQMVQTMRSWAMVMPGETFGCIGCHENKRDTFRDSRPTTDALKRPPQEIQPLYAEGEIPEPEFWKTLNDLERRAVEYLNVNAPRRMDVPQGFSYIRDIQPIWDSHCVKCHYGDEKTPLNLLGDSSPYTWKESYEGVTLLKQTTARPYVNSGRDTNPGRDFSRSYLELTNWGHVWDKNPTPIHPQANEHSKRLLAEFYDNQTESPGNGFTYVTWFALGRSISPMIPADFWGARHSKIMKYLEPDHYGVQVSEHEKDLVKAWIDLCVPFCGSYMEANTWDHMTHTYIHFYRDQCRPTYLFQEAKRLRHAEIEVANLRLMNGEKDVQIPEVLGGMEAQKAFVEVYEKGLTPEGLASGEALGNEVKNLALNPKATVFSLTSYPWAESNSHWKYRYETAPTNAIDGNPETYWKPNLRTDLWLKVSLGKERKVTKAVIRLHLEPGQEKTWSTATLEFSDGTKQPIQLRCTAEPQEFTFPARSCEWVKLTELKEAFPLSANGVSEFELY